MFIFYVRCFIHYASPYVSAFSWNVSLFTFCLFQEYCRIIYIRNYLCIYSLNIDSHIEFCLWFNSYSWRYSFLALSFYSFFLMVFPSNLPENFWSCVWFMASGLCTFSFHQFLCCNSHICQCQIVFPHSGYRIWYFSKSVSISFLFLTKL